MCVLDSGGWCSGWCSVWCSGRCNTVVFSSMVWCSGVVGSGVVVVVDFVLGGREVVMSLFGMFKGCEVWVGMLVG